MPINVSRFVTPESNFEGLYQAADSLQKKNYLDEQRAYRNQKDQEADQARKLALVRELTDLDKYKTGNDVADAVGNHLMSNVYQKYTNAAKTMPMAEMQAGIQKDMAGTIGGMNATKEELANADHVLANLKQAYPHLDYGQLYNDVRNDIVHRRLNGDGSDFVNPMQVPPSQLNLADPEVLARYVHGTPNLDKAIQSPQGMDPMTVAAGNPDRNVEYTAKVPHWAQPNYSDAQMKNGFLPSGFMPQLSIKSESLPQDFLPALKGQDRKIVTPDVHQQFMAEHPLEVIAGTKSMFPNYDNMKPGEKELAQRDFLYQKIKALDHSNFSYKSSKTPSAALLKFYAGGTAGADATHINDLYKGIDDAATTAKADYEAGKTHSNFVDLSFLPTDAQEVVLTKARNLSNDKDLTPNDVKIIKGTDGRLGMYRVDDGTRIGYLNQTGVNLKAQAGVKEKRAVIEQGNHAAKPSKDPLGIL